MDALYDPLVASAVGMADGTADATSSAMDGAGEMDGTKLSTAASVDGITDCSSRSSSMAIIGAAVNKQRTAASKTNGRIMVMVGFDGHKVLRMQSAADFCGVGMKIC